MNITIYLKHFDTAKQTLSGVGKVYILRTAKVGDLIPMINQKMGWMQSVPLILYEVYTLPRYSTVLTPIYLGNQAWND